MIQSASDERTEVVKKTAEERREEREWSDASSKLGQAGWNAYMYARMAGTEHEVAMDLGFAADMLTRTP